jgi:hypothetical protein
MPVHRLGQKRAVFLASIALVAGGARAAGAPDDPTLNEIIELNKKALVSYQKLDVAGAAELLTRALELCDRAGLAGRPVAARTHVHLGVVYTSGLKKRPEGLAEFRRALAIDPAIAIAKSLRNPEVEAAFDEAKAEPGPKVAAAPASTSSVPTGNAPAPPASLGPSRRVGFAINHPPVTRAIRGRPVTIKVQVPPGLGAWKAVLAYRAEDSDEFLVRPMVASKNAPGWFEAQIPLAATRGARVDYYLEVRNLDDQPIAGSGSPEVPHPIALALEVSPEDLPPPEPIAPDGVKPPAADAPARLWLVFAFGGGGGYHSGTPEMNPADTSTPPQPIHVSGFGLASLGHLAPEIGYFATDRLAMSVQGRLQYVTRTQDVVVEHRTYHPARLALAGLAKLTWFLRDARRKLRPFVNAQVGAGKIRHSITTPASANLTGCGQGPTCKDTVMGGPGLAGLGGGVAWMLRPGLGAYAAVNVLAGFPNFMVNGDLNVGIAVLR